MDLKQHCLDAAIKLMIIISKKWDTVVSKLSFSVDIMSTPVGYITIIISLTLGTVILKNICENGLAIYVATSVLSK